MSIDQQIARLQRIRFGYSYRGVREKFVRGGMIVEQAAVMISLLPDWREEACRLDRPRDDRRPAYDEVLANVSDPRVAAEYVVRTAWVPKLIAKLTGRKR